MSDKPTVVKFNDVINDTAEFMGEDRATVKATLNNAFNAISSALAAGHTVATPIGRFSRKDKPAQKGGQTKINPFTKEEYITSDRPARNDVKFRANKALKYALN